MDIQPGTIIDRYLVDSVLGRGGMAEVYRIRHQQLGSLHALKVLISPSASVRERLLQEGRAQAQLRHRNIVTVTDVVDLGGSPGLVMEYISGPTLAGLLEDQRSGGLGSPWLPLAQVDLLVRAIISGVAAAHEHGLVHRDLKPSNILLEITSSEVVPKVADFGLVKIISGDDSSDPGMTRSGMALGTPAYMAPEQVRDSKTVDHRGDLFALGAILYEVVTGRQAFIGQDMMDIFTAVVNADFIPPESIRADIPPRMKAAIEAALTVDLNDRVQSCEALLKLWCDGEPQTLPWDSTELRWAPEKLEQLNTLGAGAAPSRLIHKAPTTPNSDTWSPEVPSGTISREVAAPSSEALKGTPPRSSSMLLVLGVVVALIGAGWLWMEQLESRLTGSDGLRSTPIAPVRKAPIVPPPVEVQELPVEVAPDPLQEEKEEEEEEEEEKDEERVEEPVEPETKLPPAPPPVETPKPTEGRFSFSGTVESVGLRGHGRLFGPGPVPPGTYQVYVRADNNSKRVGTVTIKAGEKLHLVCNRLGCK